jgi:hypothetical protein
MDKLSRLLAASPDEFAAALSAAIDNLGRAPINAQADAAARARLSAAELQCSVLKAPAGHSIKGECRE